MEPTKSKEAPYDVGVNEIGDAVTVAPIVEVALAPAKDHSTVSEKDLGRVYPTDEELETLRRVPGSVPWLTFTIAFVELCERFSYYGTTAVCTSPLRSHTRGLLSKIDA